MYTAGSKNHKKVAELQLTPKANPYQLSLRNFAKLKVGFISARLGDIDGVSLETEKWIKVFKKAGHEVYALTGEGKAKNAPTEIVRKAKFSNPVNQKIISSSFKALSERKEPLTKEEEKELEDLIEEGSNQVKEKILEWVNKNRLDVLILENCNTIPMQILLGVGVVKAVKERPELIVINHNHDFYWERSRYDVTLNNVIQKYLDMAFPLKGENVWHATINTLARKSLRKRRNISSHVVPNGMDYDKEPPEIDEWNKDFKKQLGLNEDNKILLQPTRVIERKSIEIAVKLLQKLDPNDILLITGGGEEDEGTEYIKSLNSYIDKLRQQDKKLRLKDRVIFMGNRFGENRGWTRDGKKIYILYDVYANADLVTYPSTFEGFGNALIEAIWAKKPVVVYPYSVYKSDIKPTRLELIEFPEFEGVNVDKISSSKLQELLETPEYNKAIEKTAKKIRETMKNPNYIRKIVEKNYKITKEHFSYRVLDKILAKILKEAQLERQQETFKPIEKIEKRLIENKIYTKEEVEELKVDIEKKLADFQKRIPEDVAPRISKKRKLTPSDVALIIYPNSIEDKKDKKDKKGKKEPLEVLKDFVKKYGIKITHILPFYPWDTDKGFSVLDYRKVDERYGNWKHIKELSKTTNLMFDFVVNHASIDNPIVQGALIERHISKNDTQYKKYAPYKDFVIAYSEKDKPTKEQLKKLIRPRATPVLTKYSVIIKGKRGELKAILGEPKKLAPGEKIIGTGWVWTTFSRPKNKDGTEATRQVDLNFANPKVLLEALDIILFYIENGASFIRLDAIGYLWKKLGSTSLHEKETHILIQSLQDIISLVAPGVTKIAEVNEPQKEVFKYLEQDGEKEVDMVYQFTHFPLAIHAVLTGNAKYYMEWINSLKGVEGRQFILTSGSHDGLGFKPLIEILPEEEIKRLEEILVNKHKAKPKSATLPGGKEIVYEICVTPWNLINSPDSKEPFEMQLKRYLAVTALGLMHRGLPAIYINGLIGAPNNPGKLDEDRTINREIFDMKKLFKELDDPKSQKGQVLRGVLKLINKRGQEKAFDPNGPPIRVALVDNDAVVATILESVDKKEIVLQVVNVSDKKQNVGIDLSKEKGLKKKFQDLLSEDGILTLELEPYEVL